MNEPGRKAMRALAKKAGVVVTSGIAVAEIFRRVSSEFRERAVGQDVFKALQDNLGTI